MCGSKPAGDLSYLADPTFLNTVKEQTERVFKADGLPKDVKDSYHERLAGIQKLIDGVGSKSISRPTSETGKGSNVICSLVSDIDKSIEKAIEGVKVVGHVLVIPDFGTVSLGEVTVGERWEDPKDERPSNYFELMVIKMNLGCVGHGIVNGGGSSSNGTHKP